MLQTTAPHNASAPTNALRLGRHVTSALQNLSSSKKSFPDTVILSGFLISNGACPRLSRSSRSSIAFMVVFPEIIILDISAGAYPIPANSEEILVTTELLSFASPSSVEPVRILDMTSLPYSICGFINPHLSVRLPSDISICSMAMVVVPKSIAMPIPRPSPLYTLLDSSAPLYEARTDMLSSPMVICMLSVIV